MNGEKVNLTSPTVAISKGIGMVHPVSYTHLKMLYRENEILIFDEPTAVLTPPEIDELMAIMKNLAAEGKSCLLYTSRCV